MLVGFQNSGDEHAGDGLLLEPFTGVSGVDPRLDGELGGGGRAESVECGIEAESQAKPDAERFHRCGKVGDEAAGRTMACSIGGRPGRFG